ncbi:MAG: methyltransferase domain-containing protein [SAR202 cluster bacterium]|nr:methyltransferase domain-containing protein [SAR202 cluster bacterium]
MTGRDPHAPIYKENNFTRGTLAEVDFLVQELGLRHGARILDVGCGAGRHSVELARRGFRLTSLDLSGGQLRQAVAAAESAGVRPDWVRADATRFSFRPTHDAAICLCEGALGLLDHGEDPVEHDLAIFRNIRSALVPEAPFILTALNGYRTIRQITPDQVASGEFDPATMTQRITEDFDLPDGPKEMSYVERPFTPPELIALVESAGFDVVHVWSGTAARWERKPLDMDEMEVMIVAKAQETDGHEHTESSRGTGSVEH